MPVKTYVNDNGTWRDIRNIHVNDGGTWRNLRSAWVNDGSQWRLVFQSVYVYTKIFYVDEQNFNLYNALIADGWNGNQVVDATLTVNAGVRVYASTVGNYAMTISGLPSSSTIRLTNNGTITGRGGNGGAGGNMNNFYDRPNPPPYYLNGTDYGMTNGNVGSAGGPAMFIRNAITIINNGVIGSGGGGGGGSASSFVNSNSATGSGGGGGAGSSNSPSSGGAAGISTSGLISPGLGNSGSAGGNSQGAGGLGRQVGTSAFSTGPGGAGGARGSSGTAGSGGNLVVGFIVTTNFRTGGAGGVAGVAINGNSYAAFSTLGTVSGSRIN